MSLMTSDIALLNELATLETSEDALSPISPGSPSSSIPLLVAKASDHSLLDS